MRTVAVFPDNSIYTTKGGIYTAANPKEIAMANRLYLFITTLRLILPPGAGAGDVSLSALTEAELIYKC